LLFSGLTGNRARVSVATELKNENKKGKGRTEKFLHEKIRRSSYPQNIALPPVSEQAAKRSRARPSDSKQINGTKTMS
jgi:hypothetical protein